MCTKTNANLWRKVKQCITCTLLTCCLVSTNRSASAEESNIATTISLIPLPASSSAELPLTSFQADRESTIADPRAAKIAERLHMAHKEIVNQLTPSSSVRSSMQPKQHSSANASSSPPSQFTTKKPLPSSLMHLQPSRTMNFSSQHIPGVRLFSVQAENVLEMKMRSIGTPRQIKVMDKGRVQSLLSQAVNSVVEKDNDEKIVRAFLNNYRASLRIDNPDDELSLNRKESDQLNHRHLRFNQKYQGLPVWPSELIAHLDPEGNVDSVDGAFIPTPRKLLTKPIVTAEEAVTVARAYIPGSEEAKVNQPELIVYGALERPARLGWKMELDISAESHWTVVVDSLNSQILSAFNNVQNENVRGAGQDLFGNTLPLNVWFDNNIYFLVDTSKSMFAPSSILPSPDTTRGGIFIFDAKNQPPTNNPENIPPASILTSNSSNTGWLSDGVSAAFNLSVVYDYYLTRHNRNSIDGQGGNISALVRYGKDRLNASWNPVLDTMLFGDALPFAAALDVVAHEMTHGVTSSTANLIYQNQSGALNEAFSDILGEMVDASVNGAPDWIMGEVFDERFRRDFRDPSSINSALGQPYPFKMSQYYVLPNDINNDHGGVHINSSIINHAYYLLAEGLNGAIGISDAERIFYRALTTHLTRQSEFIDARLACIQSAQELFGNDSPQAIKVAEAFDTVEIFDSTTSPTPTPSPSVSGPDATLFVSFNPDTSILQLARREEVLGDSNLGNRISQSPIKASRPSVTADGNMAAFVKSDNDFCLILTNNPDSEICLGLPGLVHSVAMAPDGEHFGFVLLDGSGNPDKKITVIALDTNNAREFTLVAPVSEGLTIDSIEAADTMVFTANSRFLIYDALNAIKLADGSQVGAWSIYALDLVTGNTLLVVPPQEGLDIAFPALGHTSDDLITFEAADQSTGQSTVLAGNLHTRKVAAVGTVNNDYAVPSYTGDDTAIVYSMPDANQPTQHSIYRQSLASDHITPSGDLTLWLEDADYAVIYRRGAYQKLTISNNDISRGTVTSDVGGINCGDSCSFIYPEGTAVNLTARANTDSTFTGWGGACSGESICTINLNAATNVTATFVEK
ncbi:MAG: M4 family metallopeptidase [Methylophilus sp.]